jgi:hypothetical protein
MAVTTQAISDEECDRGPGCSDCAREREVAPAAEDFAGRHREAYQAMRPEDKLLDAILSLAVSHDRICQESAHQFRRLIGTSELNPATTPDVVLGRSAQVTIDDAFTAYRSEVIEVCAIVAAAAQRRISGVLRIFVSELAEGFDLNKTETEELMRPIFRESGIEDRFEARHEYEVYGL